MQNSLRSFARKHPVGLFLGSVLLLLAVLIGTVLAVRNYRASEGYLSRYVRENLAALDAFADAMGEASTTYDGRTVRRYDFCSGGAEAQAVTFVASSFGLAPSGSERGFVRFRGDTAALGLPEDVVLEASGGSGSWSQTGGDNGGTFTAITGDWYYYEWHW